MSDIMNILQNGCSSHGCFFNPIKDGQKTNGLCNCVYRIYTMGSSATNIAMRHLMDRIKKAEAGGEMSEKNEFEKHFMLKLKEEIRSDIENFIRTAPFPKVGEHCKPAYEWEPSTLLSRIEDLEKSVKNIMRKLMS